MRLTIGMGRSSVSALPSMLPEGATAIQPSGSANPAPLQKSGDANSSAAAGREELLSNLAQDRCLIDRRRAQGCRLRAPSIGAQIGQDQPAIIRINDDSLHIEIAAE